MNMVFERYPNGGGEMVLALKLADFADDDGKHIFPSIKTLAEKTRQSERTVQYQLRKMEEDGWLQLVHNENGGRTKTREYRISADWIKGAEIAPLNKQSNDAKKGAKIAPFSEEIETEKGAKIAGVQKLHRCNPEQKRVQNTAEKGATAIAPEQSLTVIEQLDCYDAHEQSSCETKQQESFFDDDDQLEEQIASAKQIDFVPKTKTTTNQSRPAKTTSKDLSMWDSLLIDQDLKDEFVSIRKAKRMTPKPTDRALKKMLQDAKDAGLTPEQAIEYACDRGWASFQYEYWANSQSFNQRTNNVKPKPKLNVANLRDDDWLDDSFKRMIGEAPVSSNEYHLDNAA